MDTKPLIEEYVALCQKTGRAVQAEMLVELERVGRLPPQERYYPATSVVDEVNLYQRLEEEAQKTNEKDVDKYARIIELLQDTAKICNVNDCDQIAPLLDSLRNAGYTRAERLEQNYVYDALEGSFRQFLAEIFRETVGAVRESAKQDLKYFLKQEIAQKAIKARKQMHVMSEMAQYVCRTNAIGLCVFRAQGKSQLLDLPLSGKLMEDPAAWKQFDQTVT